MMAVACLRTSHMLSTAGTLAPPPAVPADWPHTHTHTRTSWVMWRAYGILTYVPCLYSQVACSMIGDTRLSLPHTA